MASRASSKDFTEFPIQIALTNTEVTRKLLDETVEYNTTMVFASTREVYVDPEVLPQPELYNGNVNTRGKCGCYHESNRFGATLAVAYENEYDVNVRTVRIFSTYGPCMRPDDCQVIPPFLSQVLSGEDLTMCSDGS